MRIEIRDLVTAEIYAGSSLGQTAFAGLLDCIDGNPESPTVLFLDFTDVEYATASFLRECIFEGRNFVRARFPNYYPVVANPGDSVEEELGVLLEDNRGPILSCVLDEDGNPSRPKLLGTLEPKQRTTFKMVREVGETNVRELMEESPESEDIGRTAWNNRLSALTELGLIIEESQGRSNTYRPLPLEE